jgi:hypothetical protein
MSVVETVDLSALPSQTGLGPLYVPRCPCGWSGASSRDRETAATNARLHGERHEQEALF